MDFQYYSKQIEKNIDLFLKENLDNIPKIIQNNTKEITGDFKNYVVEGIHPKTWGIYIFYIKPKKDIATYEDLWELWEGDDKKLKSPKAIKKRFEALNKNESHCFYVGKSQNLATRINQHIDQKTKGSTYGLKLSEHNNFINNNTIQFSYITLDDNPEENFRAKNFLLISLETKLREELNPLVGKQ